MALGPAGLLVTLSAAASAVDALNPARDQTAHANRRLPPLRLRGGGDGTNTAAALVAGLRGLNAVAGMTSPETTLKGYLADATATSDSVTIMRYSSAGELVLAAVIAVGQGYGIEAAAACAMAGFVFVLLAGGLNEVGLPEGINFAVTLACAGLAVAQLYFKLSPYVATALFAAAAIEGWFFVTAELNALWKWFHVDKRGPSPLSRALLQVSGTNYALIAAYLGSLAYTGDKTKALVTTIVSTALVVVLNAFHTLSPFNVSKGLAYALLAIHAVLAGVALR